MLNFANVKITLAKIIILQTTFINVTTAFVKVNLTFFMNLTCFICKIISLCAAGVNDCGERLIEMCRELGLLIGNTCIRKHRVNKRIWESVVHGGVADRALMDYLNERQLREKANMNNRV